MGLFGDLLSAPFKIVGGVTGTDKITNIVSKPLDALSNVLEGIDE